MFHLRRLPGLVIRPDVAGRRGQRAGQQHQAKLDKPHLDQWLAPVALYSDALLSQVLMASTHPADVASAAHWSKSNPNLSGDVATKAVDGQSCDPG